MLSRMRTFMRSMKPWSLVKTGAVRPTATSETAPTMMAIASKTRPMTWSTDQARHTEMTHRMGTGKIMRMLMSSVCWMTLMSESVRVIIEPVPNCSKSAPEKDRDAS